MNIVRKYEKRPAFRIDAPFRNETGADAFPFNLIHGIYQALCTQFWYAFEWLKHNTRKTCVRSWLWELTPHIWNEFVLFAPIFIHNGNDQGTPCTPCIPCISNARRVSDGILTSNWNIMWACESEEGKRLHRRQCYVYHSQLVRDS